MMNRVVMVVVGLQGSGKSIAAEMLREDGFEVIELGDIWRELVRKAGIPFTDVKATREFTLELRVKHGKDIYARYAVERIKDSMKRVAIMGVRSTYELDYLKGSIPSLKLVAIYAPFRLRFERMTKRGKPEDPKNLKDFRWLETRIKRGYMSDKKEEAFGLNAVIKKADYRVSNTSTVEELGKKLNKVIEKISGGVG